MNGNVQLDIEKKVINALKYINHMKDVLQGRRRIDIKEKLHVLFICSKGPS